MSVDAVNVLRALADLAIAGTPLTLPALGPLVGPAAAAALSLAADLVEAGRDAPTTITRLRDERPWLADVEGDWQSQIEAKVDRSGRKSDPPPDTLSPGVL